MKAKKHNLVFIVEDDDFYSLMLDYSISSEEPVQCLSFRTGEESINNLDLDPMLIILDYGLPGMNGKEVFLETKKRRPDIPVVILTAKDDAALEREFMKEGAHDYLVKEKDSLGQVKRLIEKLLVKEDKKESQELFAPRMILVIFLFITVSIILVWISRSMLIHN